MTLSKGERAGVRAKALSLSLSLSRLLKKALRVAPAGAVRGVDLAAQKKCGLILDRTLDISGGDEKVDPNVTIWPIGEV